MLRSLLCLAVCFLLFFTACGDDSTGPSEEPPADYPGRKADGWVAPSGSGSCQVFNIQCPSGDSDRVYFWLSDAADDSDRLVCYANGYTQSSPEYPRGSASHYAIIPQTGEVVYSSYTEEEGTTVILATDDLLTESEFTTGETITGFIPMIGGDKVLMCMDLNAVVLELPSLARIDTVLCTVSKGFSVEDYGTYGYSGDMILRFDPATCQMTQNALTGSECTPVINSEGMLYLLSNGMLTILDAGDLTTIETKATPSSSIFALHPVEKSVFLYTVSTGNTIDIFDLADLSWQGTVSGLTLVNPLEELVSHPGRNEIWGLTVNSQNRCEVFKIAP